MTTTTALSHAAPSDTVNPARAPGYDVKIFAPKQHDFCVIIAVLNEGERIRSQLLAMQPYRNAADILITDGGSTDGALPDDFISDKIRGLFICGQRPSLLSSQYAIAMQYALQEGYKGIIMMDGNGKDNPEAIPAFIQALQEGYGLVQGSRFMQGGRHENTPFDRVFGIRLIFNPIMRLVSGFPYTDSINGFKAVNCTYLMDEKLQPFHERYYCYGLQYYLTFMAPRLGFRVKEIPVTRSYPRAVPTPTKIRGLKGRLMILWELLNTITGAYSPISK